MSRTEVDRCQRHQRLMADYKYIRDTVVVQDALVLSFWKDSWAPDLYIVLVHQLDPTH